MSVLAGSAVQVRVVVPGRPRVFHHQRAVRGARRNHLLQLRLRRRDALVGA